MKVLLVLLLLGATLADEIIKESRARELKEKDLKWKVTNLDVNPQKKEKLEVFVQSLQRGNTSEFLEMKKSDADVADLLTDKGETLLNLGHQIEEPVDMEPQDAEVEDIDKEVRGESLYDQWGIPINFDGRTVWEGCIHSGGTQGNCNGCWAFGIANHLSDRFCIKGKNVVLSVQDLMECTSGNRCCEGGYASNGYRYMIETGIVAEGCKRYKKKCNECKPSSCTHYKCKPNSMFWADTIQQAKREIYKNGPIEAVFEVYDDFPYYESGIYHKTSNTSLGIHTVEVIGWGTENGIRYWLCKNSWGDDWGDNGFFKIKLGECGINNALTTCAPLV